MAFPAKEFSFTRPILRNCDSGTPGVDAREVAPGVVLDFDAAGRVIGIDVDGGSAAIDLSRMDAEGLPLRKLVVRETKSTSGE